MKKFSYKLFGHPCISVCFTGIVPVPGLRLGVVVLMSANNGAVPLVLGKEISLASGVVQLRLTPKSGPIPQPRIKDRAWWEVWNE